MILSKKTCVNLLTWYELHIAELRTPDLKWHACDKLAPFEQGFLAKIFDITLRGPTQIKITGGEKEIIFSNILLKLGTNLEGILSS